MAWRNFTEASSEITRRFGKNSQARLRRFSVSYAALR